MSAPIFTRRHYRAVAGVIREAGLQLDARDRLVQDFVILFGSDNDRFDQVRFRDACACRTMLELVPADLGTRS